MNIQNEINQLRKIHVPLEQRERELARKIAEDLAEDLIRFTNDLEFCVIGDYKNNLYVKSQYILHDYLIFKNDTVFQNFIEQCIHSNINGEEKDIYPQYLTIYNMITLCSRRDREVSL